MPWVNYSDVAPTDKICRRVRIPNDPHWIGAINGALLSLAEAYNHEALGTLTADEIAEVWRPLVDEFWSQDNWCMVGQIIMTASLTLPPNTLLCDGTTQARVDYPDLYNVLPTSLIVDAEFFKLPELSSRMPMGAPWYEDGSAIGYLGGEQDHTLTVDEMPTHSHTDAGHSHTEGTTIPTEVTIGEGVPVPAAIGSVGATGTAVANISTEGGGQAHNNLPPFCLLYFAIYYK